MQTATRLARPLAILDVTPETVTDRLSYRLQQMIGAGRQWSYRAVSSRTGIDVRFASLATLNDLAKRHRRP